MRYAQSLSRMFLAGVLVTTLVVGATTAPAQAEETLSDTEITSLLERIKELVNSCVRTQGTLRYIFVCR